MSRRSHCTTEDILTLCDGFLPPEFLPLELQSDKGTFVNAHRPPFNAIDRVLDQLANHPDPDELDAWDDEAFRSLVKQVHDHEQSWPYQYSPRAQLFLSSVRELFAHHHQITDSKYLSPQTERAIQQTMQILAVRLKEGLRDKAFQRAERNWRGEARRRERSVTEYVNALFSKYSKLLVLRLDFYPRRISAKDVDDVNTSTKRWKDRDFDDVLKDVGRFLNNRRSNVIFDSWVGHIVKFEFAPERGYHAHAIIFLDGHEVKRDGYYGMKYANYWIDRITKGEGTCFCANKAGNKRKYRFVGIGMIEHRDAQMRFNLGRVIQYLCKSDLYLTTKKCVGQKLLRKGHLKPASEGCRRGRPRTNDTGCAAASQKS